MTAITNIGENTLSASLKEILPNCDRVDALVGYFYFSGFQDLHNELKDKQIRILVGMDIDKRILEKVSAIENFNLDIHTIDTVRVSRSSTREEYIKNFVRFFNDTDYFDNESSQKAIEIFLNKILDGSLQIKKTPQANHAKCYILHNKADKSENGEKPGVVIVGSSNLSISGLKGQQEFNRILIEKHYYETDARSFEVAWENPENIALADIDSSEEFVSQVKKRIWLYQLPPPLMMYYRVLHEYFSIDEIEDAASPQDITRGKFTDLKYQKDAINLGIDKIRRFGGVVLADVVGLGKSVIASAIAHSLDYMTIVIAPPHLETQWKDYMAEFDFKGQVYTTGRVEEALERHGESDKELLIILDEAHKHRNEDTDNYRNLHKLCAGNFVMALSATPFNNDPKDIYALIKLFSTPGQSTIKTVENLSMSFHELFARYKKVRGSLRKGKDMDLETSRKLDDELQAIADDLRRMIDPLIIRRSRLDLEEIQEYKDDLEQQGVAFANVKDPELLEYDLGDISELYSKTLDRISSDDGTESFEGVRYKPAYYIKRGSRFMEQLIDKADEENGVSAEDRAQSIQQAQVNVAKFMRRLLVRRFESSMGSFRKSLHNMVASSEKILEWHDKRGVVPIYKKGELPDIETLESMTDEEQENTFEKLEGRGLIEIPVSEMKEKFRDDLEKDITVLRKVQEQWSSITDDPKYNFFKQKISSSLKDDKNRKIIIFTEFSDTADYLKKKLEEDGFDRVCKYASSDASRANKELIRGNFDAGIDKNKQANDFDVLIATDAISEGFNLHRAGTVINYDIPYNPTRVIQRVGRINRINKKVFDELYIYNFFPTSTGERETKTQAISTLKLNLIQALLGEDTKILTKDEDLKNYFAEKYKEEKDKMESRSWDAPYRNTWMTIKGDEQLLRQVLEIPHRARIARKFDVPGVVAFAKRNGNYVFAYGETTEKVKIVSPEFALPLFNAVVDGEKPLETTANFEPIYKIAKEHIFKDNTKPPVQGKRKQNALGKVKILSEKYPPAKDLCLDITKIIKDLDGLPNRVLKEIGRLNIGEDPRAAFQKLGEIMPNRYIDKIFATSRRANDTGKLIVLSEELISP